MKEILKYPLLFFATTLLVACTFNDDDCMKTISIPQIYVVNNQSYSYDVTQEVPCGFPEPSEPEIIDPPILENFSYEVLSFEYTPDTGNNTSRLRFEIRLNNPNEYAVNGIPVLTMYADGMQMSGSYSNNASVPCYQIEENSSCILTYDQQESLDLGNNDSIEVINVEYVLTN